MKHLSEGITRMTPALALVELDMSGEPDLTSLESHDRRLRRVIDGLIADPALVHDFEACAAIAGISNRPKVPRVQRV